MTDTTLNQDTDTTLKLKTPSMWKVVIHNDDFTPINFVIGLIMRVFNKSIDEAVVLTHAVHNNGKANVGPYTKEVALTKVYQVKVYSEQFGHPLTASAEEA